MGSPAGLMVDRIEVSGPSLDASTAHALMRDVESVFTRGSRAVVIEMSQVSSIDWTGVVTLATIHRRAPAQTRLALASLGQAAQTVARITRLHELFDIYATADGALAAMSG